MVKYLSFRASSFALRCFLRCKLARLHSVTHPLFEFRSIASYFLPGEISVITGKSVGQLWFPPPMFCCELLLVCERLVALRRWVEMFKMGMVQFFALQSVMIPTCRFCPQLYAATSTNHGFWVHATFRMGDEREDGSLLVKLPCSWLI